MQRRYVLCSSPFLCGPFTWAYSIFYTGSSLTLTEQSDKSDGEGGGGGGEIRIMVMTTTNRYKVIKQILLLHQMTCELFTSLQFHKFVCASLDFTCQDLKWTFLLLLVWYCSKITAATQGHWQLTEKTNLVTLFLIFNTRKQAWHTVFCTNNRRGVFPQNFNMCLENALS